MDGWTVEETAEWERDANCGRHSERNAVTMSNLEILFVFYGAV